MWIKNTTEKWAFYDSRPAICINFAGNEGFFFRKGCCVGFFFTHQWWENILKPQSQKAPNNCNNTLYNNNKKNNNTDFIIIKLIGKLLLLLLLYPHLAFNWSCSCGNAITTHRRQQNHHLSLHQSKVAKQGDKPFPSISMVGDGKTVRSVFAAREITCIYSHHNSRNFLLVF